VQLSGNQWQSVTAQDILESKKIELHLKEQAGRLGTSQIFIFLWKKK